MLRCIVVLLLLTKLTVAQVRPAQPRKPESKPVRISPTTDENPKIDHKLLRRGRTVVVHAIISKTGEITTVEFVKGNADLMPEVQRTLKKWKYKPYVYQGHPVEVETNILVNFDPMGG